LLQFRDKVLHAIGKFRLHEFAPALNKFLFHPKLEGVYGDFVIVGHTQRQPFISVTS
jgi:hypothetical protein